MVQDNYHYNPGEKHWFIQNIECFLSGTEKLW